jgi:hypothetical protein
VPKYMLVKVATRIERFPVTVSHDPARIRRSPTRGRVQQVGCPLCHVAPTQHCVRANGGRRESNHRQRVAAYLREVEAM